MWKAFFRKSRILGIDAQDKTRSREHRIDIRQCDQTDSEALMRLCDEYGGFDIIIDDGSHINEHVIKSFQVLFPRLRPNGFYAVEDTQTSYWATWGGGIASPRSSMEFFKSLVDGLNHEEYPIENYKPSYFDLKIVEVIFLHGLVLIRKGENDEKSNDPGSIQREIEAAHSRPESRQKPQILG
jgi:demethylmacrocin O-methyltransferase